MSSDPHIDTNEERDCRGCGGASVVVSSPVVCLELPARWETVIDTHSHLARHAKPAKSLKELTYDLAHTCPPSLRHIQPPPPPPPRPRLGLFLNPSPFACYLPKPQCNLTRNLPLAQVLHIRNLPYETTDEELRELAAPFGQLVQTKLNVGTNRNQAFIEFPDMQQAINMASYFQNSAEPAKVREDSGCVGTRFALVRHPARVGHDPSFAGTPLLVSYFGESVCRNTTVGREQLKRTIRRHARGTQPSAMLQISCACCLQVRGKTVYLQYSTRNEIVNAGGGGGERPSNCLLVTLENLDVRTAQAACASVHPILEHERALIVKIRAVPHNRANSAFQNGS